mmetsp:Transcript_17215/g.24691  ORF Transcript_17215/g.24691 Transcript_17215/m.24691 type:complete len:91 (+) Transcript_17215:151-423(+)
MFRNSARLSSFLVPPCVKSGRTRLKMGEDKMKAIAAATRLMNQYAGSQVKVFSEHIPRFSVRNPSRTSRVARSLRHTCKTFASDEKSFLS